MSGFIQFLADPTVHKSVLGSMAITAIILALPKPGVTWSWGLLYKFFYDSVTGFWSLKSGHPAPDPTPPVPPAPNK